MPRASSVEEGKEGLTEEEERRLKRLERLKNISRAAQLGAYVAGHPELAELPELIGAGAEQSLDEPGALRKAGANIAGKQAGKFAQKEREIKLPGGKKIKTPALTGGQAAALGGAVAGALHGEGPTGIAKSAASWWLVNFALGYITLDALSGMTGWIGATLAVLYLDFHYLMSKLGSKIFGEMTFWQKICLAFYNFLVVAIIVGSLGIIAVVATIASCDTVAGRAGNFVAWATSLGNVDFCAGVNGGGGGSGGGGESFWEPSDLVSLSGVTVDFETSDPRVRSCMLGKVQEIFAEANKAGLTVIITSAFRSGDFPSRHAYGEAVDIALDPAPPKPWSGNPKIAKLVEIARSVGFQPSRGDTLDEYNKPIEGRTTGGHVHVEFNKISEQASHCAPYANPPAPFNP